MIKDPIKMGATFLLMSETIKAFPTFSKPLTQVRHIVDGTDEAKDARYGYILAVGWSLFVATAIANSTNTDDVFVMWFILAGGMVGYYEYAIRSNS